MVMLPKITGESGETSAINFNNVLFKFRHERRLLPCVDVQLNVWAVTGHSRGENRTAARYKFQIIATNVNGRDQRPREKRARLNLWGVMKKRPTISD